MEHINCKQYLHVAIFCGCLIFTIYQSINCMVKYHSIPKGTSMGLFDSDKVGDDFPAITFCTWLSVGGGETAFNADKLKSCNIYNG